MRIVTVFLAAILATSVFADDNKLLRPGTTAPLFSLPTLSGDREALSTWCGQLTKQYVNKTQRVVVLSFWATYCQPCAKEIPILQEFYKRHAADSLKVFLVSNDAQGAAVVDPCVKERKYELPVLLDQYHVTGDHYGVKALPALFFISTGGVVRYCASGFHKGIDMAAALDTIYACVKTGRVIPATLMPDGETVPVGDPTAPSTTPAAPVVKQIPWAVKLEAASKLIAGGNSGAIAKSDGVDTSDVHKWADELKDAAKGLWEPK